MREMIENMINIRAGKCLEKNILYIMIFLTKYLDIDIATILQGWLLVQSEKLHFSVQKIAIKTVMQANHEKSTLRSQYPKSMLFLSYLCAIYQFSINYQ